MKIETSAGGVVYRTRWLEDRKEIEFLIVQHSGHHRWVLPKGWIEKGETKEKTAVREVREEAGVEAEVENTLWLNSDQAVEKLDYPGEKRVVEKALKMLK